MRVVIKPKKCDNITNEKPEKLRVPCMLHIVIITGTSTPWAFASARAVVAPKEKHLPPEPEPDRHGEAITRRVIAHRVQTYRSRSHPPVTVPL